MTITRLFFTLIVLNLTVPLNWACVDNTIPTPTQENMIVVRQSGGASLLATECRDSDYITSAADYVVEGTVEKVECRWNQENTSIFTYTYLSIDRYVKGGPLPQDRLQIVTHGGTVGEITQWVEDQPIFHQGKRVRIYLQETNGELAIVCAWAGVEELPFCSN